MAKAEKVELVNSLTEEMKNKSLIVFNYKGIKVADMNKIRGLVRKSGSSIKVVKNTYLKRALDNLKITPDESLLKGMNAIAVVENEFSAIAKFIHDAEKLKQVSIQGGYYDSKIVGKDYVIKLASIPSQEVLYSMLVGCLQGPMGNLVYTLQAIADQKNEA